MHITDKRAEQRLLSNYLVRPTNQQLELLKILVKHGPTGAALSALMSTPGGTSTSLLSISLGVNSEVSNEVEVTPGVLIRALPAAPVGPCYINYVKWFQLLILGLTR